MFVLHDHQRPGTEVAPPFARRYREDRPRERRARIAQLLHHRRQFRPQQGLGRILDRLIHLREVEKLKIGFIIQVDTLCHKLPNFIEKCAARRRASASSSAWRTSTPTAWPARRSGRTRSPSTARCCWPGRTARIITYCGYIPVSQRHASNRSSRHRDHQEGIAGRHAGILLPDAAAGLGGSPETGQRRASRWTRT